MIHEHQAPNEVVESIERLKVLNSLLNTLLENQKVAFSLSKYDEMSLEEIAEILNTSVSNIESLINRAKKNLKKNYSATNKNRLGSAKILQKYRLIVIKKDFYFDGHK